MASFMLEKLNANIPHLKINTLKHENCTLGCFSLTKVVRFFEA